MLVGFEHGRILSKLSVAWILCSVAAAGAPNVQRDFASEENFRLKKDVGSLSTEFQQILPVQVDFGSLVNTINQRISGIEGNVIDLEERDARLEKEASKLKQKLESSEGSKEKMDEEISRLKTQLKEMKEEITRLRKEKFIFIGNRNRTWDDAREECESRGADLAMHLTEDDLDFVFSEVIPSDKYAAWIGGHMNAKANYSNFEESFEWLDGDRISADDGLWQIDEPKPDFPYSKSVYIHRGPWPRKDGKRGPAYMTVAGEYNFPFLCKIR